MHILRLNAVPDFKAHSQLGVWGKKKEKETARSRHMAAEMMSTLNNVCWRLHCGIRSEDKDRLIYRVRLYKRDNKIKPTLERSRGVTGIVVLQTFCGYRFVICQIEFPPSFWLCSPSHRPPSPEGKAALSCMKLNLSAATQVKRYHTNSQSSSSC